MLTCSCAFAGGGSGFTGTTAVKLGAQSIPFITDSDTQLTVTIPAMPQGPQTLLVTNGSTSASVPFMIT